MSLVLTTQMGGVSETTNTPETLATLPRKAIRFSQALPRSGGPLASTNSLGKSEAVQPSARVLFITWKVNRKISGGVETFLCCIFFRWVRLPEKNDQPGKKSTGETIYSSTKKSAVLKKSCQWIIQNFKKHTGYLGFRVSGDFFVQMQTKVA